MHWMFWYSWPERDTEESQGNPSSPIAAGEQDIQQIATKIYLIFMIDFQDGV